MRLLAGTTATLAAAVIAQMASLPAMGAKVGDKVTIYLMDRVNIDPTMISNARSRAQVILAGAGVDVTWRGGEAPIHFDGSILIEIKSASGDTPLQIPKAMAIALLTAGNRIEVFWDKVKRHSNPEVVLSYVLVHEIAHLLQGVARHSQTGIMKAEWDGRDLAAMLPASPGLRFQRPLGFERLDLELIRQGVLARRARVVREGIVTADRFR